MRRHLLCSAIVLGSAFAETNSGNRTTPPTVNAISPRGVARGTTVELTVEGLNLAGTKAILFDHPGITGQIVRVKELPDLSDVRLGSNGTPSTIDLGPLPPRNQVTINVDVAAEAEVGSIGFRLLTPLGTSPEGRLLVEPYYGEAPDKEPNDTPEGAFETFLPSILVGDIGKPGDVDLFKIHVKAGEELVFENGGMQLGSTLQPIVDILREDLSVAKSFGADGGVDTAYFSHKFDKAGIYYIRISDYAQSGRASNSYRIKVGNFKLATSAFPLGLQSGKEAPILFSGLRIAPKPLSVKGAPSEGEIDTLRIRPVGSFSEVRLALGRDPEVLATGTPGQTLTLPVTVNGRIDKPAGHSFKFHARKGEKLVLEVLARRFDSDLDSYIEVLDAKGAPIEIATVKATTQSYTTLRDHDSASRGIRIDQWTGWAVGDYIMVGNEIMRVEALPRGPDDDTVFDSFNGQRLAYFSTSGEAHHQDQAAYKVQIHPAGARFSPTGLPIVQLYARNDDGGPGFGKDSKLDFTAPADGDYTVVLRDVRGLAGPGYTYRLNIRPPRPDFRLAVNPRNPNIPAGGAIPVTVTALRLDGYNGPIQVKAEELPKGVQATDGVILPDQVSTTLLLSAAPDATLEVAAELKIAGTAKIGTETLARYASPEDKLKFIALMPKPDVTMVSETREVTLEPGGTAEVKVSIQRGNGFAGRVPVAINNLPPRVRVMDVGLNGVLINEDETHRSFTIEALDNAEPVEQTIYVGGVVETRSALPSTYAAPQAIRLRVVSKKIQTAGVATP